jgi:hypothetical protein
VVDQLRAMRGPGERCHSQGGGRDNAMNSPSAFESPRLTLKRAKHHIRDLKEAVQKFTYEQPWTYLIDAESRAPNVVHKMRFQKLPPADVACILFDAVNNLRAALDQIGYSAATASGKVKPRGTNFPFGKDKDGVEEVFQKNRARLTLPAEIMDLFRSVEPYEGGNGQLLWAINKLCNTKKHNTLVPTMVTGAVATFRAWVPDGTPAGTGLGGSNWMPKERELILMVVPPDVDADLSGNFSFTVSVDSVDLIRDKPIVMVLEGAAGSIADLLVSAEAICQRAGFLARP